MDTELSTLLEQGHAYLLKEDFKSAEDCFNRAIALDDECAMAHNNRGWTYECLERLTEAVCSYQRALELDVTLTLARVNLASLLAKNGRSEQALALWNDLIDEGLFDRRLINEALDEALANGATQYAAKWAQVCGVFLRGSQRHLTFAKPDVSYRDLNPAMLTIDTLRHDIDQIKYLRRTKAIDLDFESMLNNYERVRVSLEASGDRRRRELNEEEQLLIGDTYGKIWHIKRSPSIGTGSPWGEWDPASVEKAYWDSPLGLCVIDNFLSKDVLIELREFCLQSTVWFANHYSHGRLGAFFREGFNSPILIDLADQFARLFPNLIGDTHRLMQLWGFKYSPYQPVTHPHADFAAANLNVWIAPDNANLDPNSGGLVVSRRRGAAGLDARRLQQERAANRGFLA